MEKSPFMLQKIHKLPFSPPPGFASPHAQTAIACFFPTGTPPPSLTHVIPLKDGDALCGEVSTPPQWQPHHRTVVLIHGLGGSHESSYMVRLSRKFYDRGLRVIRLNMRCCGSGFAYASRPYHGGSSEDLHEVLISLKERNPDSPITIVGFSLGGNIALKLGGELGDSGKHLIDLTVAICPPIDLAQTATILAQPHFKFYNHYYLHHLAMQTKPWSQNITFSSIFEFDTHITAPIWNFKDPNDYYVKSSSRQFLPLIKHRCRIIFAIDDPFIDPHPCLDDDHPESLSFWLSDHGGHMGFFGWSDKEHRYYWLDGLLCKWIFDEQQ